MRKRKLKRPCGIRTVADGPWAGELLVSQRLYESVSARRPEGGPPEREGILAFLECWWGATFAAQVQEAVPDLTESERSYSSAFQGVIFVRTWRYPTDVWAGPKVPRWHATYHRDRASFDEHARRLDWLSTVVVD